jgi:hypothetical protein
MTKSALRFARVERGVATDDGFSTRRLDGERSGRSVVPSVELLARFPRMDLAIVEVVQWIMGRSWQVEARAGGWGQMLWMMRKEPDARRDFQSHDLDAPSPTTPFNFSFLTTDSSIIPTTSIRASNCVQSPRLHEYTNTHLADMPDPSCLPYSNHKQKYPTIAT